MKPISTRPWPAERSRVRLLQEHIAEEEREAFPIIADIDVEAYILCAAAGTRKYCVNEDNLKIMNKARVFLLLAPAILALVYIVFLSCQTNKIR